jgi:transcriptional antiterminator NusG
VIAEDITAFAAALKEVPEFTKMLKADEEIAPIYPHEEAVLKRLVDKKEIVGMSTGIIENDKVRILEGPLVGLEGIVKKINRHKRTAVLKMELFDRVMQVEVGLEITEKR